VDAWNKEGLLAAADSIVTSVEKHLGVTVLSVDGVIDLATAQVLEDEIEGLLTDGLTRFVVDLTDVTFMASVGLKILVSTKERLGDTAGFAVVADGPATSRPIQLTHLDDVFALYSTLDEALAGLPDGPSLN